MLRVEIVAGSSCLSSGVHLWHCMCRYRPATWHHRRHRVGLTGNAHLGLNEYRGRQVSGGNTAFGNAVEWFVPTPPHSISWPSFSVLGSETQWRSEKTSIFSWSSFHWFSGVLRSTGDGASCSCRDAQIGSLGLLPGTAGYHGQQECSRISAVCGAWHSVKTHSTSALSSTLF